MGRPVIVSCSACIVVTPDNECVHPLLRDIGVPRRDTPAARMPVVSLHRVTSVTGADVARAAQRRSRLRAQLVLLGVAVVVSVFGALAWANWFGPESPPLDARFDRAGAYALSGDTGNRPVEDESLPEVPLLAVDGSRAPLRSDGRPMVVNVWAENCKPCEAELQYFAAVDASYGDDQVRFVGVNVNDYTTTEQMIEFAADRGVGYELLRDDSMEWRQALRVVALPLTLFVDGDGQIVSLSGQVDEQQLRTYVAELVGAP